MFTSGTIPVLTHKAFSSDHKQPRIQHNRYQLSLFDLPSPYPFQCFSDDLDCPERAALSHDHELDLILFHHQQLHLKQQHNEQQEQEAAVDFALGKDEGETLPAVSVAQRMRSSKKDRHSKITTARGLRDRRMRLSIEVAREFFDLQDVLGFDTASKTVEWLISQSKSAIREIFRTVKTSDGSSGIAGSYAFDCKTCHGHNSDDDARDRTEDSAANQKQSNRMRQPRKNQSHRRSSSAIRESRRQARERARERTLEKMCKGALESLKASSIPLETGEESTCIQTVTTGSNLGILTESEEIAAGRISMDVSSNLAGSRRSPAPATGSDLILQEIGILNINQKRNYEQFLQQWEAYSNYGCNPS